MIQAGKGKSFGRQKRQQPQRLIRLSCAESQLYDYFDENFADCMIPGSVVCHISFNHDAFDDRIYWKELCTLQQAGYRCVHISVADQRADFVSAEGIRLIRIQRKKIKGPVWWRRLRQLLLPRGTTIDAILQQAIELKAALYHYHDLQLNALASRLRALPWQPKLVYDVHEAHHLQLMEAAPGPVMRGLYRLYGQRVKAWELKAARHCHRIFATDPYTLEYFQNALPEVPAQLLYNYSFFSPENGTDTKKYDLIYTGLLNRGRGLFEMAETVALLKKAYPRIRLLLIGPFANNEMEHNFRNRLTALQIEENVALHPAVPFSEIQGFYRESRIGMGLFRDTPKYRTFIPIKLFEYMAFGLPVVFSKQGPSADIIRETDCGLLVAPQNTQATAEAIRQLLTDEALYRRKSENGKQAVATKYNWDREKSKLLAVYEQLLQ